MTADPVRLSTALTALLAAGASAGAQGISAQGVGSTTLPLTKNYALF